MDNHIFRSALSGFNRQDVMEYIERTQKQAEEAAARLGDEARQALDACTEEKEALSRQLEEMTLKFNHAKNNWEAQAQAKESFRQDVTQRDQTVRELTEENQGLFRRVQDLEDQLASMRLEKERITQLELDAHHRADVVVEQAQERAKAITEAAEANARAVTDQAKTQAQTILTDAESAAQAVLKKAKLSIEDTAEDFKEVLESFQTVSGRVAEGLKLLERTMGEFPVGLNALREDLDGLYGQITAREAEALGLSAGGNQDE